MTRGLGAAAGWVGVGLVVAAAAGVDLAHPAGVSVVVFYVLVAVVGWIFAGKTRRGRSAVDAMTLGLAALARWTGIALLVLVGLGAELPSPEIVPAGAFYGIVAVCLWVLAGRVADATDEPHEGVGPPRHV